MGEHTVEGRRPPKGLRPREHEYLVALRERIEAAIREFETQHWNGGGPLVDQVVALLPPLDTMPEEFRLLWGTGPEYDLARVGPFVLAALESHTAHGFRRMCGMYATGYRSDLRRRYYRLPSSSMLTPSVRERETRRLYQQVKAALVQPVEADSEPR